MCFRITENDMFKKYIWIQRIFDNFENVNLTALPTHNNKFIKTKITTYDKN